MTVEEFWKSEEGKHIESLRDKAVNDWSVEIDSLLLDKVEAVTTEDGLLYPARNENNEAAQLLCVDIARKLRATHLTLPKQMLLNTWDKFGVQQAETKRRIHRGVLGFELMTEALLEGNRVLALRWALLTQVEDLLSRHEDGDIRKALSRFFGIADTRWNHIRNLAYEFRDKAEAEGWEKPFGFSEYILLALIQSSGTWPYLLTSGQNYEEFHLSKPFLKALLEHSDVPVKNEQNPSGVTSHEKGKRFENLAFYLCSLLPGCVPRQNVQDEDQAHQSDVVVRNLNPSPDVVCDFLGRHFLVECKNWSSGSVPVSGIGYFLFLIRLTHTKFGILFTRDGVTGDHNLDKGKAEIAARALIRRAYHEDRTSCVVLKRLDIDSLVKGDMTFWQLLMSKMHEFRFGTSSGDSLSVIQAGKPSDEIKPVVSDPNVLRPFGLCKGEFVVPDDFDDPLPESIIKEFEQ